MGQRSYLYVFPDTESLKKAVEEELLKKHQKMEWCPNYTHAVIVNPGVTCLLDVITTLKYAHRYAGHVYKSVVFKPHVASFDKAVVQYLKSLERTVE